MTIRQAMPDDVHALIELDTYLTSHSTRRVFIYEAVVRQQWLVALNAGQCIGYLVLTHDFFNHAFVALVVVSPTYQRLGVALRLLSAAEVMSKTPRLFISTNASNSTSQALIAKAGFVPSGRIENLGEHVRLVPSLTGRSCK